MPASSNYEPLPVRPLNIIDSAFLSISFHFIGDQNRDTVNRFGCFIYFGLIQSHPQLGTSSAESLDCHPQVFTGIFIQDLFDFISGDVGYFHGILLMDLFFKFEFYLLFQN
jgi:hypothetical protein